MKKTNIIVSDITCMKDSFCVAGWDMNECRMKRLLIDRGYWDKAELAKLRGHSWIIVDNEPLAEQRDYPHRTEDMNIDLETLQVKERFTSVSDLAMRLKASISSDIRTIFNSKVKESSYVPQNTRCASLGAINIATNQIEFITEAGKLRANIVDNDGRKYCLRVSCKYIRDVFAARKDVEELNKSLAMSEHAHCRIGLARPFLIQENHCYLMLNGLFLF